MAETDKGESGQAWPGRTETDSAAGDRGTSSLLEAGTANEVLLPRRGSALQPGDPRWAWLGENGLRAGWSLLLFVILVYLLATLFGTLLGDLVEQVLHWKIASGSPRSTIFGELPWVLGLVSAMALMGLVEKRRLSSYYLADGRGLAHFASGLAAGFAALSLLVGGLALGGWLQFGPVGLSGGYIAKYACLWALGFMLVGAFEEGSFRCYLQYTLARGVNFWWAAGIVGAMCGFLLATAKGNGAWGIYAIGIAGVGPAWWLGKSRPRTASFWQAAWAGSTGFGFIHTFNHGETWVGIFAAAAIGFVFCVSIRATGSAWWAIGCHASWDWAETFFYGTADSGFVAKGHLLTSIPKGAALWSGGTDGPEGSVLVLPVIALLAVTVLTVYGRRNAREPASARTAPVDPEAAL